MTTQKKVVVMVQEADGSLAFPLDDADCFPFH
jgi:hypothetical protein